MKTTVVMAVFWVIFQLPADDEFLEADLDKMTPLQYNSHASVPPELVRLFNKAKLGATHEFDYEGVNPFYLCGDFDGDNLRDYATRLRPKGSRAEEVESKIAILRGNGRVNWLDEDLKNLENGYPGPAWYLHYKNQEIRNRGDLNESPPPRLLGDAIVMVRPESSSALVYWDGKKFSLYWGSD